MKSFDRYLVKFFYLAVFSCLIVTAFLVGCGGSNNPSGPAASVSTGSTTTTETSLTAGTSSLIGKVVTDNQNPVGNVTVKLFVQEVSTGNLLDTGRSMTSLTSGEFNFNGLGTGTFVLKVEETSNFAESSKLAIISSTGSVDTGNLIVFSKVADTSVPTLNIRGKIIDPLSNMPLSVAQVTLDSGQTTVTNAFGIFQFSNVASGSRKLAIYQPGVSSYSINFEVRGITAPTANSVFLNNQDYPINVLPQTVDLVAYGVNLTVNPNLHESGTLLGTVKRFVLNSQGFPTSEQEAYPNYEFDLWQLNLSNGTARRFGSVVSNLNGTWRVDQLPPYEDNNFAWFAVPVNTQVTVRQADSGNVVEFTNSSAIWSNRDPVLGYGYLVKAGETTVMDFTVPAFVYTTVTSSVNAIADAGFSVNGAAKTTDTTTFFTDDLTFSWTGPGTSTQVVLEFSRIYTNPSIPVVSKTFTYTATATTDAHSYNFKPSTLGLDYGRFTWLTKAIDPFKENTEAISDSYLFTVRPGVADMTPTGDIKIQPATYTVQFVAPTDPEAAYAILELYDSTGAMVGRANEVDFTNQATFNLTWGPNAPVAGGYTWRIRYYYNDGPPMDSETANINFVP